MSSQEFQMPLSTPTSNQSLPHSKLAFNVDIAAIAIALVFAALVRLNIIRHIGW
jgi:hypothetical protein